MKLKEVTILTIALLACIATTPAHAAENSESAKSKKVCKKFRPTGTRFSKKVCMTQHRWDELKKNAQDLARNSQRLSLQQSRPGSHH